MNYFSIYIKSVIIMKIDGSEAICINLKQGELLVILVPSGCGKTTLLKCITGTLDYEEGSATIAALDTSLAYSTGFYSEGDTITFKNVSFN